MKNGVFWQVAAMALFLVLPGAVHGQSKPAAPTPRIDAKAQVYLPGFAMQNPSTEADRNLGGFVDRLLAYRLGELGKVQVNLGIAESCAKQFPRTSFSLPPPSEDNRPIYVVRGSVEFHPPGESTPSSPNMLSSDSILNYELTKSVNCASQVLMRRSEPLSRQHMLDSLTVMADALALRLGDEISRRTRIDLVPLDVASYSKDEQDFANSLVDALVQALARSDDFEPNDLRRPAKGSPGDYSMETALRFSRSANFLRGFGEEVQITLRLRANGSAEQTSYPLTGIPIRGYLNKGGDLIPKAVASALKGISNVKDAREAGLSGSSEKLNELQANDLVLRAQEALCEGAGANCTSRPDVALLLLQQAAKSNAANLQVQEWTGRALLASGKSLDAARSFDAILASNRSLPADAALRLETAAADAWYRAESFTSAAARYDQAAQLLRTHPELANTAPDINLRRSLSHRFAGDRLGALDALVHPVAPQPETIVLVRELKHEVEILNSPETDVAIARLEAEHKRPDLNPALELAYEKQAGFLLGQSQVAAAEKAVRKAQALNVPGTVDGLNYLLALVYFNSANLPGVSQPEKTRQLRDSSRLLKEILGHDPTAQSYGVMQTQLLVCSDYLGDKECVRQTMTLLERLNPDSIPTGLQLDIVELLVLDRGNDPAKATLNHLLPGKGLPYREKTVGYFYHFWIALAENQKQDAGQFFHEWEGSLEALRRSGESIEWFFGGARRNLQNADPPAKPGDKDLLLKMIDAMEDPNHAVPRFNL